MTMGKRLESSCEVRIVDETNGYGWILSRRQRVELEPHPRRGSSTLKKDGFGTCI